MYLRTLGFTVGLSCLILAVVFIGRAASEPGVVLVFNYEKPADGIFAIDTERLVTARISYPPDSLIVDIPSSTRSGTRFAYETIRSGKLEIAVLEGTSRSLYDTGINIEDRLPALSPDGAHLALWTARQVPSASRYNNWTLQVRDLTTGQAVSLTSELAILPYGRPIWSSDGSRFVVRYYRAGTDEGMFVADVATQRLISLRPQISASNEITLSPDGSRLAFRSTYSGGADIYAYDIDADILMRLTDHPSNDRTPDWSPDGSQIAFVSYRDGVTGVYVMDANGENVRLLAPNVWSPRWSPDGKHLAVLKQSGSDNILYVIDAQGRELQSIMPLSNHNTAFIGWLNLPD